MPSSLVRHPASDGPAVSLGVHYERQGDRLWVRFVVEGDVEAVAWPEPKPQGRGDCLWEQTCFEVFVTTGGGYREFNLSPSGQWASYRFSGYRAGMDDASEQAMGLRVDLASDMVALDALIDLPPDAGGLSLSAVILGCDGSKSFWALTHPSDRPDFHHPASFILDLTEPA